ncbi:hypothetical protein CPB84DRAFT_1801186 [Gymnopilus junonius]|uniref:Uncharacterized protein n=1 Tax=Gymnopilus junonius TaxID=109634 RepID=A0A9P5N722_GYMJU|nr:hypothetical protein CPB84DRAFT_1801186 [Gymnopilus junonius]
MGFFYRHFPLQHPFSSTTEGKKIVLKLAEDVLTTWRNKIGQVTIDYMENTLISELEDSSAEYISAWCHWALSGTFKCRPFYYKTFIDGDDLTGQAGVKTNIFCHPVIACALGHHLGRINILPTHLKEETRPTGALIMAIQSAYRAIARWSSGSYTCPARPFSDFSGDNWGDSEMRDASKAPDTIPPYTIQGPTPTRDIERVVKKLSDKQWKEIMIAVHAFAVMKGKKRSRSSSGDDAAPADATAKAEVVESDFEIEDNAEAQDAVDMTEDSNETTINA